MILLALSALLAQGVNFDKTITLSDPCIAIPKLLEKMSVASGSKLVADDDVNNDLLAIRVTGKPISELMSHLTDAEGSDSVLVGSTYHLKRSQARIRAAEQDAHLSGASREALQKDASQH